MKKVMMAVAALMLMMSVVCAAGCSKTDDPNNGSNNNDGNGGSNGISHEYVDLGLPSGTLWATCNVGASSPEDYGDYFAWGEIQPKSTYDWSTYKYCNGSYSSLTKYCKNYGFNGFTDNLIFLLPEDDAATANWGADWRMPTAEEWGELHINTTCDYTTLGGVNGYLFTANNGRTLFLPAAGSCLGSIGSAGRGGTYWSSRLGGEISTEAYVFDFRSNGTSYSGVSYDRCCGFSVRPVRVN